MKTLYIGFACFDVVIRLKGLSYKAMASTGCTPMIKTYLCKYEGGYHSWGLHNDLGTGLQDGKGNLIKEVLVKYLKELHFIIPFEKIKVESRSSPFTAEELMIETLNK